MLHQTGGATNYSFFVWLIMNREKEGEKEKACGWDIERQIIEKNKQRDRKTEWGRNNRKTEKENRAKER